MMNIWVFVGQALLLGVLITLVTCSFTKNFKQRIVVMAALLVTGLFLPVNGLSIAQWLRSVVGDLSILTLLVFANILAQRLFGFNLLVADSRKILLQSIVLVGVVFYPMALGVSAYDPYQLGYVPVVMPAFLILFSIIAWIKLKRDLAIILLLPMLAFNLKAFESVNLWDYTIDPILLTYALVQCMVQSKLFRFIKIGKEYSDGKGMQR